MLPDEGSAPDRHVDVPDEVAMQFRGVRCAEAPSWAPAGWFMALVVGAAIAWALSLPVAPNPSAAPSAGQVFRPEWFLASTALAYLVWLAARSSWRVAIPSVILISIQMWSIADEGAHRLGQAGAVTAQTDLLYVIAMLQVLLFVCAGVSGGRRSLADRRWTRLVGALASLQPAPKRQDH